MEIIHTFPAFFTIKVMNFSTVMRGSKVKFQDEMKLYLVLRH